MNPERPMRSTITRLVMQMEPDMLAIACRQAAYDAVAQDWPDLDDEKIYILDQVADAVRETVLAAYGEPLK